MAGIFNCDNHTFREISKLICCLAKQHSITLLQFVTRKEVIPQRTLASAKVTIDF